MSTATAPTASFSELIRDDRVHGSLYTDPAVYSAELERIWYRTWVYVGHVSELPQPNDYVRKSVGPQSVIMTRDRRGEVHVLLNRCSHRANAICADPQGNAGAFRCPYHGWTFSNTGKLLGYPFKGGYDGTAAKRELGLARMPRVESHRGFVFGSFAEEGPSLREHLGAAADTLDRLCRLSPEGEVEFTAGWLRHRVKANWKMLLENETDGYHPQFVHASIFAVAESHVGEMYGDKSIATARDLGNGHTEHDLRPEFRRRDVPLGWFGASPERLPDYVARMEAAYGAGPAREILVEGAPHVMIFPNLFIAEVQVFVLEPLGVDETVQHVTALQLKGAPDMNRRLLQQAIGSVGPAGFLLADDSEMYERNQRGVRARRPEWLVLKRGMHRERRDDEGVLCGDATDETTQRGIWKHYRTLIEVA